MEKQQWSWVQTIVTTLVAILVWLFLVNRTIVRKRLPLGPNPWPVVGNLPHLGLLPHKSLAKLAEKFGTLMHLRFGSVPVVVVSSPQLAEEFLKTHDLIWASRGRTAAGTILSYNCKDIAFGVYGPRWRYSRKVFLQELMTNKRISDFKESRKQEILSCMNGLINESCDGTKAVELEMPVRKSTLNTLSKMLINKGFLTDDETISKSDSFQAAFKEAFHLYGVFYIGDFIPWLDQFDIGGYKKRMHASHKVINEVFDSIIEQHRRRIRMKLEAGENRQTIAAENKPEDILEAMLTRTNDGRNLDDDEVKGILVNVLLAGSDTTSTTVEWALSEMLKNPRILERAQEEMDSVVGRERLVEESDLPDLPYLNAVVKETLRLHPAAPLMAPHESTQDCVIAGYNLPAKTRLIVNLYAIHRDPSVWERPLEFDPERFLGSQKDVNGADFDFLPFGSGRRSCPGRGLGLLQVQYTLAMIVQTCKLSLSENLRPEDLDMEEYFGVTVPRLNPLHVRVVLRLAKRVLEDFMHDKPL